MSDETSDKKWYHANWLKAAVVGGAGYLLGSIFPAGYMNYLVRSILFPETLIYQEPEFDRTRLNGATTVTVRDLVELLETNPSLFESQYLDKPVKFTGSVEHFLDGAGRPNGQTVTIDTGERYGPSIIITFDDRTTDDVLALREGENMTARCLVTGTSSNSIHMEHCEGLE